MVLKIKLALIIAIVATVGIMASGPTVFAAGASIEPYMVVGLQNADGMSGNDFDPNNGSSAQLVRNASGVNITIHTNNLPEGAYTLWAIIFNDPSKCTMGTAPLLCGGGDLEQNGGDLGVQSSVLRVGGHYVNNGDNANFGGRVRKGDSSEAIGPGATPLLDPLGAEIHFVIRFHGDEGAAELPGSIHTVGGGCPCFDPQAVIPIL